MHLSMADADRWCLGLVAAVLTIRATSKAASRQISAAQEQTKVAREQIDVTLLVERGQIAKKSFAFLAMLEAAMGTVVEDVAAAQDILSALSPALPQSGHSPDAYAARREVKKTAFADIRSACVHLGGQLTAAFLRLDKEIDDLAAQCTTIPTAGDPRWVGANDGLPDQLERIKLQATALREEAGSGMKRCSEFLANTRDTTDPY